MVLSQGSLTPMAIGPFWRYFWLCSWHLVVKAWHAANRPLMPRMPFSPQHAASLPLVLWLGIPSCSGEKEVGFLSFWFTASLEDWGCSYLRSQWPRKSNLKIRCPPAAGRAVFTSPWGLRFTVVLGDRWTRVAWEWQVLGSREELAKVNKDDKVMCGPHCSFWPWPRPFLWSESSYCLFANCACQMERGLLVKSSQELL